MMGAKSVEKVKESLQKKFIIDKETQFTIEIQPGTCNKSHLEELKQLGVNRLSIGVQSFSDKLLRSVGRNHSGEEAYSTCEAAREVFDDGRDSLSFDLLIGIPEQRIEEIKGTLHDLLRFEPDHISPFILSLDGKEKTDFFAGRSLPHDEEVVQMYSFVSDSLTQAGWDHYDVTHIAKNTKKRSVHTMAYLGNQDFLGFGASASSKIKGIRMKRPSSIKGYLAFIEFLESLDLRTSFKEIQRDKQEELQAIGGDLEDENNLEMQLFLALSNGLSSKIGFSPLEFTSQFPGIVSRLKILEEEGTLVQKNGKYEPNGSKGFLLADGSVEFAFNGRF